VLVAALWTLVAVLAAALIVVALRIRREGEQAERQRAFAEDNRRLMIDAMNEAYVAIDAKGRVTDWNERATLLFGYTRGHAIGRQTTELIIPPEDHLEFDGFIDRFVKNGDPERPLDLRTERNAIDRDGRRFPVELAAATLHHEGTTSLHTFMHDITDRRRSREEADAHAADVAAISEATSTLARTSDPTEARGAIVRGAQTIAGCDFAALFETDPEGTGLRASSAVGAKVSSASLKFSGPSSGAVRTFTGRVPIFSGDLESDERVTRKFVEPRMRSAYWVPVKRGDTMLGVIVVAWASPLAELPGRVARMMDLVAAEAAVAIERAGLLERLARMAQTDDLTGLPNRRAWDAELVREIARAKRRGTPLTIAIVDLDHFKAYNDAHGHLAGDRLLKHAAGAWQSVLRETDMIARYGGEEFAIALPACPDEEAVALIDRLRSVTPDGESCSAGIASWDGSEQPEELLGRADRALYAAKRDGRNRTVLA
jgi:diguanylate cyclase (GGDEF)-like protein/PAS domain S-box-containing protein